MELGVVTVIFENIQTASLSRRELEMIKNSGINYIEIVTGKTEKGVDIFDYQDKIYVKQFVKGAIEAKLKAIVEERENKIVPQTNIVIPRWRDR
ncbi:hypothetical protein KAW50_06215 [candidate division WOR-3 bacterium]|nr:hypothetical protein [candidate division WOR-3 bacterium]